MTDFTHVRRPDPVKAWKHDGSDAPEWLNDHGINAKDLEEHIPVGNWIVCKNGGSVCEVLSDEHFQRKYEGIGGNVAKPVPHARS